MLLKGTLPFRGLVLYKTISAYVTGDDFLKTTFRGQILEQHWVTLRYVTLRYLIKNSHQPHEWVDVLFLTGYGFDSRLNTL